MNIEASLRERILILDGAMGTKIQSLGLTAESYHQGALKAWPVSLVGNNDVLCLTAPEVIRQIHDEYIGAGADIITTNTFYKLPYINGNHRYTYVITALDRMQNESKAVKKKVKL